MDKHISNKIWKYSEHDGGPIKPPWPEITEDYRGMRYYHQGNGLYMGTICIRETKLPK